MEMAIIEINEKFLKWIKINGNGLNLKKMEFN